MAIITQTPSLPIINRVDFNQNEFNSLVWEKGRVCIIEKALRCPCKSESTNELSSCKNCGSTGWVFINPKRTKLVIQAMSVSTQFKNWSEEEQGSINVSAMAREELSFMDRISIEDGESIHSEVVHFNVVNTVDGNILIGNLFYEPKEILYIALFVGANNKLRRLQLGVDFEIEGRKITISNANNYLDYIGQYDYSKDKPSITIRYKHNPVFHIVEMKRETMESYTEENFVEKLIHLPVSAIAKRAHYIADMGLFSDGNLLDNSYTEDKCKVLQIGGVHMKAQCVDTLSSLNILSKLIYVEDEGIFYTKKEDGTYKPIIINE